MLGFSSLSRKLSSRRYHSSKQPSFVQTCQNRNSTSIAQPGKKLFVSTTKSSSVSTPSATSKWSRSHTKPINLRGLGPMEFQEEGTTVQDAKAFCEAYEKKGFDFVELTGGTAEKIKFEHERESTKIREAFFVEFADTIRPVFKNTVVYQTGGFRRVGAMVDAIQRNSTQGIGLGRPATAEPDLPKKIVNGIVLSVIQDAFNPNNFFHQVLASGFQIEEMGRKSMEEAGGNVMDQISDYSDEQLLAGFGEKVALLFGGGKKSQKTVEVKA